MSGSVSPQGTQSWVETIRIPGVIPSFQFELDLADFTVSLAFVSRDFLPACGAKLRRDFFLTRNAGAASIIQSICDECSQLPIQFPQQAGNPCRRSILPGLKIWEADGSKLLNGLHCLACLWRGTLALALNASEGDRKDQETRRQIGQMIHLWSCQCNGPMQPELFSAAQRMA